MHPWAGLLSRQTLYVKLQQATGWTVRIITSEKWRDDYGNLVHAEPCREFEGNFVPVPVGLKGNIRSTSS